MAQRRIEEMDRCKMTKKDFQARMNQYGANVIVDGIIGPKTIDAFYRIITNKHAPAITHDELCDIADSLGATTKQVAAVAKVETNGGGFTNTGRPKILFERHKFWQLTGGKYPKSMFNDPKWGGYSTDSWLKLEAAMKVNPWAALKSCSWGKFQIMGFHAAGASTREALDLGYADVLSMIYAMSRNEYEHYRAFANFIKVAGLTGALRRISTNAADNVAFVRGYNGAAGVEQNNYHVKIAEAMK